MIMSCRLYSLRTKLCSGSSIFRSHSNTAISSFATDLLNISPDLNLSNLSADFEQQLKPDHVNSVFVTLLKSNRIGDAQKLFERIDVDDSLVQFKTDDVLLTSISIYGRLGRPGKAKEQAMLIKNKKKSPKAAALVLDALCRCDRLHAAEGLISQWLSVWLAHAQTQLRNTRSSSNTISTEINDGTINTSTEILNTDTNSHETKPIPDESTVDSSPIVAVQQLMLKLKYRVYPNYEASDLLVTAGFDADELAMTFPHISAWISVGHMYAGRGAQMFCLTLLDFLVPEHPAHKPATRLPLGGTANDFEYFFHYTIRSICMVGGTGSRSRVAALLHRLENYRNTCKITTTTAGETDTNIGTNVDPLDSVNKGPKDAEYASKQGPQVMTGSDIYTATLQHLVRRLSPSARPAPRTWSRRTGRETGGYWEEEGGEGEGDTSALMAAIVAANRPGEELGMKGLISAVTTRLCQSGRTNTARKLLKELEAVGIAFGGEVTDTVINSLCLNGLWKDALDMYRKHPVGTRGTLVYDNVASALRKNNAQHILAELLVSHSTPVV